MTSQLSDWKLRLPPVDQFRRLPSQVSLHRTLRRADDGVLEMSVPFFWFNPQWHRYAVDRCQAVEQAVTRQGVLVSALHRDLSQDDIQPVGNTTKRIVPHRPDRAGLIHRDLVEAAVIELRLLTTPNRFGGFTYESTQWSRWKNVEQLAHPIAASAMTFPPEWHSLAVVNRKVEQLRMLGNAAIVLSLDWQHASTLLPQLVNAGLDGVMIRTQCDPLATLQQATELCHAHGLSLWIWLIPEQTLSPEDCIKCLAFGASGIAIDPLCNRILNEGETLGLSASDLAAIRMGYASENSSSERFSQAAEFAIGELVSCTRGWLQACGASSLDQLSQSNLQPLH